MRILFLTHNFPRADGDISGAFLWRLAEGLIDRGHDVGVVAPSDRGDVGPPTFGRVRVRRVRYASPGGETLAYPGGMQDSAARSPLTAVTFARLVRALARAAAEEIRDRGIQLVHAHWWVPGGVAARWADRKGRPYLVTLHGSDVALARRFPGGRALMAGVLRAAAGVTAVSGYLAAEAAATLGIPRTDIPITPMPMALSFGADLDQARSGAVFVGRLTRQKGIHDLLEALSMLRRDGAPLDLTVVGDGPERGNLKAQARALGLNVTFTGFVAPETVAGYLRDKEVFVLPALEEGLGLGVAEALAQGVPVVATRSGGIPDLIVDPESAILVAPGEPQSLAQAIRAVVSDGRYRLGAYRAGRSLSDLLSPEKVAERFESLYTRTRASRPRVSGSHA